MCSRYSWKKLNLPISASFHVVITMVMACAILNGWVKELTGKCAHTALLTWIKSFKKNTNSFFYELDEFYVHLEYMHNGITFSYHPNMKSNGEWYDWVMVWFNTGPHKASCIKIHIGMWSDIYFPSKMMFFFGLPDDDTNYAIIQSMYGNNQENDCILFERWELEIHQVYKEMEKEASLLTFMWLMLILLAILFLLSRTTQLKIFKAMLNVKW